MGTYRLVLAYCVLYSHVFGGVMGWNIGVVAVISFFVISGYVMAKLISKQYPDLSDVPAFYMDRAARLFPQYLLYMIATLALAKVLGITDPFLNERGAIYILLNATILPLGFYMFGLENALYIPPSWSLGLELSFYLVFPFFWLLPSAWKYAVIVLSIAVALAALTGAVNTDWFGYRLLPGTFFIFATGAALGRPDKLGSAYPAFVWGMALVALIVVLSDTHLYALRYNREVMSGIVIGVAAVFILGKRRRSDIDQLMGDLSYGVFLNHFLVMWIANYFGISLIMVLPASFLLAYATYNLVERPALRWRHRLRRHAAA